MTMQVTILAIVVNVVPVLSLHQTRSAAWKRLMRFIDAKWPERLGAMLPPAEDEAKARMFFREEDKDLYAIIDADISELHDALGWVKDPVVG